MLHRRSANLPAKGACVRAQPISSAVRLHVNREPWWSRAALGLWFAASLLLAGCRSHSSRDERTSGPSRNAVAEGGFEKAGDTAAVDASASDFSGTVRSVGKFGNTLKFGSLDDWSVLADPSVPDASPGHSRPLVMEDPSASCTQTTACSPLAAPSRLPATITASSEAPGFPASQAGDNDPATAWVANLTLSPENNNAWVRLDFGAPNQIDRLRWAATEGTPSVARNPANYTIEISDDGALWTTVTSRTTNGVTNGSEFVGRVARYVRLTTTRVFDGAGSSLGLFEIWAEGVPYAAGDVLRWQLYDTFDDALSAARWQTGGSATITSGTGRFVMDASATGTIGSLFSVESFYTRSLHFKGIQEIGPGLGRCWIAGNWGYGNWGQILTRALTSDYPIDPSTTTHLYSFASDPADGLDPVASAFNDLGSFDKGPTVDFTIGWYGTTIRLDASKDGSGLLRRDVAATTGYAGAKVRLFGYCGVTLAIDEIWVGPLVSSTNCNVTGCAAIDSCHTAGVCDAATGICSNPPKPDGTSCDDGNACTQTDSCHAGACVGSNPLACGEDQCHLAGTCNPATGCSRPKPDGTSCNDGNNCTRYDVCGAGSCQGTPIPGCAAKLAVEDLGTLGGGGISAAWAINDSGIAVGMAEPASGGWRPVRWLPDGTIQALGGVAATSDGYAMAINSAGVIVGNCRLAGSSTRMAFRYSDATGFETIGPGTDELNAINDSGSMAGYRFSQSYQAFRHTSASGLEWLGLLPGGSWSWAWGIDSHNNVVGDADISGSTPGSWTGTHAIRYIDAERRLQDLNEYAPAGWELREAIATNGDEIVGYAGRGEAIRAYRLTLSTGRVDDLGPLNGGLNFALAINANGAITGSSCLDNSCTWDGGNYGAFVYTDRLGLVDLNSAIDPAEGWVLRYARAINNNGDIAGTGQRNNGPMRAFRMHVPGLSPARVPRCTTGTDCASGFCSEGVCCDSACTDSCSSCRLPGSFGTCSPKPNGEICNDGNACTQADTCQAGVCIAGNPITCGPMDQCHEVGTCDPLSGVCSNVAKPNGTACNDGNACTQGDACQNGSCVSSTAAACSAQSCPGADLNTDPHNCGACGHDCLGGGCIDRQCQPFAVLTGLNHPRGIASAEGNIYVIDTDLTRIAPDGTSTVVERGISSGYSTLWYDRFTNSFMFYTYGLPSSISGWTLLTRPLHGPTGSTTPILSNHLSFPIALATTSDAIILGNWGFVQPENVRDTLEVRPRSDPSQYTIFDFAPNPQAPPHAAFMDLDANYLYWSEGQTRQIVRRPLTTSYEAGRAAEVITTTPPGNTKGMAVDGANIYFALYGRNDASPPGSVFRIDNQVGATAVPLATVPGNLDGLAIDAKAIYIAGVTTNTVWKLAKPSVCTPNPCMVDTCDPVAGTVHTPLPAGTSCSDGNECNGIETCDGSGTCQAGTPAVDDGNPCTVDSCDPFGRVIHSPIVCTALDQCHDAGTCDVATGLCSNPAKPDGTACNDASVCTQTDTCQAGTCTGGNPVVCVALDQCHMAGTCDPATGCSQPLQPDGAACNDGNACTQGDTCAAGICSGAPIVCSASDQCHVAGVCDPMTGICANAVKPDGATCDDRDTCTQTDTCQAGTCVGSNPSTDPANCPSAPRVPLTAEGSILPTQTTAEGTTIGATPGNFSVTPDGQASYSIPIWVPDGVLGMQPSLSISYNSSVPGSGPLGVGWSVSGFPISRITRCRPTKAVDGERGPTSLTGTTYCLDGERLIPVGSNGNEYHTERESFSQIIRNGSATAPTSFTVKTKDGKILQYGSRPNNRQSGRRVPWVADNTTTAPPFVFPFSATDATNAWALDTVQDRTGPYHANGQGNTITIDYELSASTTSCKRYPNFSFTEWVPKQIVYGYDTNGANPTRKVAFVYADAGRADISCAFVDGMGLRSTKQLTQIDVYGPNPVNQQVLKSYKLTYDGGGPTTGHTRLTAMQECDQSGVCKAPTKFEYSADSLLFQEYIDSNTGFPQFGTGQAGDVDGDGLDDLIVRTPAGLTYLRSNGHGFEPERPWASPGPDNNFGAAEVLDLDLDGIADAAVQRTNPEGQTKWTHFLGVSPPAASIQPEDTIGVSNNLPLYFGDFNGDGILDSVLGAGDASSPSFYRWFVRRNSVDASGTYHLGTFAGPMELGPDAQVVARGALVAPIDGSGRQAFLFRDETTGAAAANGTRYRAMYLTQSGQVQTSLTTLRAGSNLVATPITDPTAVSYLMLDVNGDGLADALEIPKPLESDLYAPQAAVRIFPNTGAGFAAPIPSMFAAFSQDIYYMFNPSGVVGDFNLDGLPDILFFDENGQPGLSDGRKYTSALCSSSSADGVRSLEPCGTLFNVNGRGEVLPAMIPFDHSAAKAKIPLARATVSSPLTHEDITIGGGATIGDFNGDGLMDIAMFPALLSGKVPVNHRYLYIRQGQKPDQLTAVTDGNRHRVDITYKPISDSSVYTRATNAQFEGSCKWPHYCMTKGMWVVASHKSTNDDASALPQDQSTNISYKYVSGRADPERGWLGFHRVTATNQNTGAITLTAYDNFTQVGNAFPYAFLPFKQVTIVRETANGPAHETVVTTEYEVVSNNRTYFTRPTQTDSIERIIPASAITQSLEELIFSSPASSVVSSSRKTWDGYDDFNNVTSVTTTTPSPLVSTSNVERSVVTNTYFNDANGWLLGVPATHVETSTARNGETQVRTTLSTPDPNGTGLPFQVTVEPGPTPPPDPQNGPAYSQWASVHKTTTYVRAPDALGQVTEMTVEAFATDDDPVAPPGTLLTRRAKSSYAGSDQVYKATETNDLNQTVSFAYHDGLGVLAQTQDANGIVTSNQYDAWGRPRSAHVPGTGDVTTSYEPVPTQLPTAVADQIGSPTPAYTVHTTRAGGEETYQLFNREGHVVATLSKTWDGHVAYVVTTYSQFSGQRASVSRPFREGEPIYVKRFTYDNMGRLTEQRYPDTATYTTSYLARLDGAFGMVVGTRDPNGYHEVVKDDLGRTVQSTDFLGPVQPFTTYSYGPFGTLRSVSPPRVTSGQPPLELTTDVSMTYDVLGRRVDLFDPDVGRNVNSYNAFGEIVKSIDGNNEPTTFSRDGLGRVVASSNARDGGSTTYVWDIAASGRGKPASSASPDGIAKSYTYDGFSRPSTTTTTVPGSGAFTVEQKYDDFGRPNEVDYPVVPGREELRVGSNFDDFDEIGQVKVVRNLANGLAYSTVTHRNAANQIDQELVGSNLRTTRAFDPARGWLNSIHTGDSNPLSANLQAIGYIHDFNGNVTRRTDEATLAVQDPLATQDFAYDSNDMLQSWTFTNSAGTWTTNYGPRADGTIAGMSMTGPGGQSAEFSYGSTSGSGGPHAVTAVSGAPITYDTAGNRVTDRNERSIAYTSFGLPRTITVGVEVAHFSYDADHARTVKSLDDEGIQGAKTVYVAGLYEQRTDASGTKTHVFYIRAGGRIVAQETWTQTSQGVTPQEVVYFHPDILGSIDAVSNVSGSRNARSFFDPFGRRITLQGPTIGAAPLPGVTIGFTGQEMDDEVGYINMNGRMYDPSTGTFISADPYKQFPFESAAYDRYTYTRNNPLRFVDPSGFTYNVCIDGMQCNSGTASGGFGTDQAPDPGGAPSNPLGDVVYDFTQPLQINPHLVELAFGQGFDDAGTLEPHSGERTADWVAGWYVPTPSVRKIPTKQQPPGTGVGPIVRKYYSSGPLSSNLTAEEIITEIRTNFNKFSRDYIFTGVSPIDSTFTCVSGPDCRMINVGNIYEIDGPLWVTPYVQATSVTSTSFSFITMEGHPEAGQIKFSADNSPQGPIFNISLWGQPKTTWDFKLYNNLGPFSGTFVQDQIWYNFTHNVTLFANAN
jgi:RHS repeat-associated protein